MKPVPAHAGRLSPWERLAFAVIFALMVAFVIVVTISAAHAREPAARQFGVGGSTPPGSGGEQHSPGQTAARPRTGRQSAARRSADGHAAGRTELAGWDSQLAIALRPVLRQQTGSLAVGVIDRSTGVTATYRAGLQVHTASIVKADILAALLLRHQQEGLALSRPDRAEATAMIEQSDDDAGTDLWNEVGAAAGVAAANTVLKLTHTIPAAAGHWGLTSTTVADQLRLLTDLVARSSPLAPASRAFELRLMERVAASQAWGVPAAASPGTEPAVKNGWLPDPQLWVINSIGVVHRDGQELLIAVMSDDQPSEAVGIQQVQQAAVAAAETVTGLAA